jgi:hypothetical protein
MIKKLILSFVLGLSIPCFFAFRSDFYDVRKSTADVDQVEGMYIFTDSKPVAEYDFLGSVKASFSMSGSYGEIRNKLARKAKKDYPTANALIIHMGGGQLQADRADAVLLK